MVKMLRMLHLEDDPVDAELVVDLLREDGLEAESDRVDTLEGFRDRLIKGGYGLVLSDYTVPGVDALEALRLARQLRPEVPFIVISGTIGEDLGIETLKLGASDYVIKQRLGRLVPSIRRALNEARDMAERQRAEEALRESERRLRAMFENAGVGIVEVTGDDRFVAANERACQIIARPCAELLRMNVRELTWPEDRELSDRMNEEVHSGRKERVAYEKRYVRGDGSPVWVTVTVSGVRDDQGRWMRSITTIEDISERKRAEETARQAREELALANAELERKVKERTAQLLEANINLQSFAHTAAHDLRSPLRAISNFSGMFLEDFGAQLDEMAKSYLERINQSAEQMGRLLHDLLEYSRMNEAELKLAVVELKTAVQDALTLLETDVRARHASVEIQEPWPQVIGHPATVVLIISNLISNGLKFVAPDVRPRVRVWAERRRPETSDEFTGQWIGGTGESKQPASEPPSSNPLIHSSAPFVRLWVEDNGIGIPVQDLPKLFGVFQRLHGKGTYPGTGLGLAIVRRGAERMGGRVGVKSEPGKGSRFWVELRAAE